MVLVFILLCLTLKISVASQYLEQEHNFVLGGESREFAVIGGKLYYFSSLDERVPGLASAFCTDLGMSLVAFDTKEEQNLVSAYISDVIQPDMFTYWTSGLQVSESWIWATTGQMLVNASWVPGEPGETLNYKQQCVSLESSLLSVYSCGESFKYICEEVTPCSTEEVDASLKHHARIGDSVYFFGFLPTYVYEAISICEDKNMTLINLETREEMDNITTYINDVLNVAPFNYWTSGLRLEYDWIWSGSGNSLTYSNWGYQEPTLSSLSDDIQACIYLHMDMMHDIDCSFGGFVYICESRC